MFFIDKTPEHVLPLISAGDIIEEESGGKPRQFIVEHLQPFSEGKIVLLKELAVIQNVVIKSFGVSRKTLGKKWTEPFLQLFRVSLGSGDGQDSSTGVNIDG